MLAVLIEFFLRHPDSSHEHRLTEGQSSVRVTWILSCAFLRNWLTKLANLKKQWLSSYVSWWQYSLSFPCDTLILCMNTVWLKVNPLRELRKSCPVRFWEIGLQSWQTSKNNGWVPTFRGSGTHCVFFATPWFFAWIQLEWRSIQWESYVNIVLCVFEKLAYKVGKFQKAMAELICFVVVVLIEFSLRHPDSLREHSLNEGQFSERVTWILSCAFLRNWLTKLAYFTKYWLSSYGSCWQYSLSFPLRHPGSLHEHSLTEGQSSEGVTWILTGQKHTFPPPWESMWVCIGNVLNSANYLGTIRFHLHTQ